MWGLEYRWWVDTTGTGRVVSEVSNLILAMLSVVIPPQDIPLL